MKVEYISWRQIDTISSQVGVIYAVDSHQDLLNAGNDLINTYLADQTSALEEFKAFKSVVVMVLNDRPLSAKSSDGILNDLLVEVEWIIEDDVHDEADYIKAQILVYVYLIASRIAFLSLIDGVKDIQWIDARDIIVTDETWLEAAIDKKVSQTRLTNLDENRTYITANRVGASSDNQNTLTKNPRSWDSIF